MKIRLWSIICALSAVIATSGLAQGSSLPASDADFAAAREKLVDESIMSLQVHDFRVLNAVRHVPRHLFVPEQIANQAYEDRPLPIGYGQTISQPSLVAYMTEALNLKETDRVLEIGTGSGYQAAIIATLVRAVYTIEIVDPLAVSAGKLLKRLGYKNVTVRSGDGYGGWPEEAPFDAIILTAAPSTIPQALIDQLRLGGRLLAPVGVNEQDLTLLTKTAKGIKREVLMPVLFVPMTGRIQR